ncbi:substrate-binding domain-containing protein [Halobacillus shinanisalinarum]|uniref:substrate-binding domain-containing protein n=1 Tax=Halobacillus shinanisalinarum TaxID=2932258 RepID=UPI0037C07B0A
MYEEQTPTTGIIRGSHDLSKGILRGLHEKGLSIPGDVSIISYDKILATESFEIFLYPLQVFLFTPLQKNWLMLSCV